ncbi:MAG: hypothetical protein U5K81_03115 [Trueperaceae bacterium]|nr:hypothetical protein [Trueperaceae bacterium]
MGPSLGGSWSNRIKSLALLLLLTLWVPPAGAQSPGDTAGPTPPLPVDVYIFHGDGCPHCATALAFLADLKQDHPTLRVHDFEVWYDADNRPLLEELAAAYGRRVQGVPMIFLGDEVWTGFGASVARDLQERVVRYEQQPAPDPMARIGRAEESEEEESEEPVAVGGEKGASGGDPAAARTVTLPLLGQVALARSSLVVSTALIGLVDGVNPCSLWVLALLLGVVLGSGSRRRVAGVGVTFLIITAAVYAAFIVGLFEVLGYLSFLGGIRVAVAVVALAIALVNLKDYLAFGRGPSLTIQDAQKPGIYRRIRNVVRADGSWLATLGATGALALGVTLVELPCTAGFPVVWTGLVADAGVGRGTFGGLLALYMAIYLLDELVIFGAAVITMRSARLDEGGGRILKLVGGSVMLALAVAMLAWPEALFTLTGTLVVFAVALAAAGLVLLAHRVFHPASSPWPRPERLR